MHSSLTANLLLKPAYLLLGEPVATFLSKFDQTQWLSQDDLRRYQLIRLRALLRYVQQHVPHYRREISERGIQVEAIDDLATLSLLPVLTKDDIRKDPEQLRSEVTYFRKMTRKTSGSTGQPLRFQKDRTATGVMNAVMWRSYRWFGIDVGDRQARIWAGPLTRFQKWKMHFTDHLQNRIRLSSFVMTPRAFEHFTRAVVRFKPQYFYGYSQSLYRFAAYTLENRIDLTSLELKAVLATAETMYAHQKESVENALQTRVVNEYGCTEAGIIAIECPKGSLHVMADSLLLEIARDGQVVAPGEEGEILITELYSSLMPLIRYRVGDRGILSKEPCPCGRGLPVLERFTGRITDYILCRDGTLLDPYMIDFFLTARPDFFREVKQWNIRQISESKIVITLCTWHTWSRQDVASYLQEMFHNVSHQQLDIEFKYEDWLETDPTGKTKMFSTVSHL